MGTVGLIINQTSNEELAASHDASRDDYGIYADVGLLSQEALSSLVSPMSLAIDGGRHFPLNSTFDRKKNLDFNKPCGSDMIMSATQRETPVRPMT